MAAFFDKYPNPADKTFAYGTAGFRDKADILDGVFYRMGLLAALRAAKTGQAVGLMVTASHNPVADNGIKLVDPDGGMLHQSWEGYATQLANAPPGEEGHKVFQSICESESISPTEASKGIVFVARDTRPSSAHLSNLALEGIQVYGHPVNDFGILTTPQLHHCVQMFNSDDPEEKALANEEGYYKKYSLAFLELLSCGGDSYKSPTPLIVDCAYGVGGPKLGPLVAAVNAGKKVPFLLKVFHKKHDHIKVDGRNLGDQPGDDAKLNHLVGAEHVQKKRELPVDTYNLDKDQNVRCCSLDGDADRIVYYYQDKDGVMHLIDGDKIASLIGGYIQEQFTQLPEAIASQFQLGVVQTAYANGAAMRYAKDEMKVEAPLAKTGVKYCHHKATEYDIGVYFEANGHGTVLFKQPVVSVLKEAVASGSLKGKEELAAAKRILVLSRLLNQATGDALSDMLACEAILSLKGMTVQDWDKLYVELPSRQLKVKVADRTKIVTVPDESATTAPESLQPAINELVAKYNQGRAFVRPSGTEDVVRIYAEAETQELANQLAKDVACAAYDNCDGVGERPE